MMSVKSILPSLSTTERAFMNGGQLPQPDIAEPAAQEQESKKLDTADEEQPLLLLESEKNEPIMVQAEAKAETSTTAKTAAASDATSQLGDEMLADQMLAVSAVAASGGNPRRRKMTRLSMKNPLHLGRGRSKSKEPVKKKEDEVAAPSFASQAKAKGLSLHMGSGARARSKEPVKRDEKKEETNNAAPDLDNEVQPTKAADETVEVTQPAKQRNRMKNLSMKKLHMGMPTI